MEALFATFGVTGALLVLAGVGLVVYYLISHHISLHALKSDVTHLDQGLEDAKTAAAKAHDAAHAAHVEAASKAPAAAPVVTK
jgi:hypothetical protein